MSVTVDRTRRYDKAMVERACHLRAEGMLCREIAAALAADGTPAPSKSTIAVWTKSQAPERPERPEPEPLPEVPTFGAEVEPIEGELQRDRARRIANARRTAIADLRLWMRRDSRRLEAVVLDPPAFLHAMLIADVVRLGRRGNAGVGIVRLGRLAVRDHINLMLPIGRASMTTRTWLAEHATYQGRRGSVS